MPHHRPGVFLYIQKLGLLYLPLNLTQPPNRHPRLLQKFLEYVISFPFNECIGCLQCAAHACTTIETVSHEAVKVEGIDSIILCDFQQF
jgi:hypothetical protein